MRQIIIVGTHPNPICFMGDEVKKETGKHYALVPPNIEDPTYLYFGEDNDYVELLDSINRVKDKATTIIIASEVATPDEAEILINYLESELSDEFTIESIYATEKTSCDVVTLFVNQGTLDASVLKINNLV